MKEEPVGVGPLPGGVGIGGKPGVDQGNGRLVILVLKVRVKPPELMDQEHALIDDGTAGQRADIGAVPTRLLKDPPGHVELPVKLQALRHALRPLHEALLNAWHFIQRLRAQDAGFDRDRPPAQKLHALLLHDDFKHLLGLAALQAVLWEEKHADPVIPLFSKGKIPFLHSLREKPVRNLEQDTYAVAGLAFGVLSGPVLQLFHDLQGVVHGLMALAALDVHHGSDAAGVMFKGRIVQAPLSIAFLSVLLHVQSPFPGQNQKIGARAPGGHLLPPNARTPLYVLLSD